VIFFDIFLESVVLLDDNASPRVLAAVRPHQVEMISVDVENVDSLQGVLNQKKAKLLYVNPNHGQTSLSGSKRRQIYNICAQNDVLILEDDPLYFQTAAPEMSFLSLDSKGIVFRVDYLSSIFDQGINLAFSSGPKDLMERLSLHIQVIKGHRNLLQAPSFRSLQLVTPP